MKRTALATVLLVALAVPLNATYIPNREFLIEVQKGNVPGHTIVNKFGRNPTVGTSPEDIWAASGTFTWLSSADKLEAVSTDVDDIALDTGARKIIVEGLDASFDEISEEITMNGTADAPAGGAGTSASFIRVNRAYVSEAGTYGTTFATGANEGDITIKTLTGGVTQAFIDYDSTHGVPMGQTEIARYTVPNAKTAYLLGARIFVDGTKSGTCLLFQRQNADDTSAPVSAQRLVLHIDGVAGVANIGDGLNPLGSFPAKTDMWWTCWSGAAGTEISITFDLLVVDD